MKSALIALVALVACGSEPMQVNHPAPGHRVAFSGPTIIGTVTSVTAGSGLTGGTITRNGTIAVDSTSVQSRVTGACTGLNTIQSINADGTVTCVSSGGGGGGTVTIVGGGTGIAVTNPTTTPTVALANVAGNTIMGNNTAGSAPPTALTGTQATALLDVFGALKGLVPSSPGGTTVYLRGDGTWATPPGTGVTNVDTLAPLQGGPITGSGTVSLTLCPSGQIYKAGASSWACAADAGITGTLTNGDLVAATGTGTVGNFAGSSPAACAAGQVLTRVTSAATGALTQTCTAIGTAGGITGGSLTANTFPIATGTTSIGNSPLSYDGSTWLLTPKGLWGGWSTITGTAFAGGAPVVSTTATDIGFDLSMDSTAGIGDVVWRNKLATGGHISAYVGAGTSPGNTNQWLSVDGSGNVTHQHNLTLGGTLDLSSHQIHNVTDPTSAQDAATKNYVDTANTNQVTGTLTSGKVPIATGANTVGDSAITSTVLAGAPVYNIGSATGLTVNTTSLVALTSGHVYAGTSLDTGFSTNAAATLYVNKVGYQTGASQFRDLEIDDGKGSQVAHFTGSTKGLEVVGAATLDSTLAVGGHVGTTGTAPTLSSCGTSPTVTGTDTAGIITLGTSSGGNCTVTFASAYTSTPACTITLTTAGTAAASISARSASAFTVHSPTDISGSMVSYICLGNPN